jgi:hypothetical protein
MVAAWVSGCALNASAQERPHPRLSADLNPVGSRVLFRAWDNAANNWSATISDGIVEEYSPALIQTSAGPKVPKLVKLSGVWQPNPKWEDTIEPPTIGLTLLYFAGETFLGRWTSTRKHTPRSWKSVSGWPRARSGLMTGLPTRRRNRQRRWYSSSGSI